MRGRFVVVRVVEAIVIEPTRCFVCGVDIQEEVREDRGSKEGVLIDEDSMPMIWPVRDGKLSSAGAPRPSMLRRVNEKMNGRDLISLVGKNFLSQVQPRCCKAERAAILFVDQTFIDFIALSLLYHNP